MDCTNFNEPSIKSVSFYLFLFFYVCTLAITTLQRKKKIDKYSYLNTKDYLLEWFYQKREMGWIDALQKRVDIIVSWCIWIDCLKRE